MAKLFVGRGFDSRQVGLGNVGMAGALVMVGLAYHNLQGANFMPH